MIPKGKSKRVKKSRKGRFFRKKRSREQEKCIVAETPVLGVYERKIISLRGLSLQNLKTDRQVSFKNTLKTLH